MDDDEEYNSEDSDSTVLLTDYAEKPEKIDIKRRRMSNLLDRGNQPDPNEVENEAPNDVRLKKHTGKTKKRRDTVDKNWNVNRYLACINKNNAFTIHNDDLNGRNVDNKQHGDMVKKDSPKVGGGSNNDEIICLDSDDETQTDEPGPKEDKDSARMTASNDCDRTGTAKNPKGVSARRFTTDFIKQSDRDADCKVSLEVVQEQQAVIRILKPSAINARRATTNFESDANERNIPVDDHVQSEKEKTADAVKIAAPKADELCNNAENSLNNVNLDSNNIGNIVTAVRNDNMFTVNASKNETDINENDSTSNENVKVNKRFADISDTERESKRLKKNAESKLMGTKQDRNVDPTLKRTKKTKSNMLVNAREEEYEKNDVNKTGDPIVSKIIDDREESKETSAKTPRGVPNNLVQNQISSNNSPDKEQTVKLPFCRFSHTEVKSDKVVTQKGRNKQMTNKIQTKTSTNNLPNNLDVSKVQYEQEQRKVQDIEKVQDNQDANKVLNTLEVCNLQEKQNSRAVHDTEGTNIIQGKVHNKQELSDKEDTFKEQVGQSKTTAFDEIETINQCDEKYDKDKAGSVQNERDINEISDQHESKGNQFVTKESETQLEEETSRVTDKVTKRNLNDNQETCNLQARQKSDASRQDKKVTNSLPQKIRGEDSNSPIVSKPNKKPKKCKAQRELNNSKIENKHMASGPSHKPLFGTEHNKQNVSKVQDKEISKIRDTQKPHEDNSEHANVEFDNEQEVVTENKTTSASEPTSDDEENYRILKFQVGFFTLIKEYLKEVYPESAKILHDLIEDLKLVDTKKGLVQTDVRYSCPNCNHVSNYSSSFLSNTENDENMAASPECGFCRGIRRMHTSYLKRFLSKKDCIEDNKRNAEAGTAKGIVKESGKESTNISISDNTCNNTNNPQTAEVKYNNASTASVIEDSHCSSTVDKIHKKITLTQRNGDVNTANKDVSEKRLVKKQKQTSQLISLTDSKKEEQSGTLKEVTNQDSPVIKDNETSTHRSKMDYTVSANIILKKGSKRKDDESNIHKADHKRIRTDQENAVRNVENLSPNGEQTNIKENDSIADKQPDKVVILSTQNITSPTNENINTNLETNDVLDVGKSADTSVLDTEASRIANHENTKGNTIENPSNTPREILQTNTSDRIYTHEIHVTPSNSDDITAVEAGGSDNKNNHITGTNNESINNITVEHVPQKAVGDEIKNVNNTEGGGKVDQNGKKNENVGDNSGVESISKTPEENNNAKNVQHPNANDKENEIINKSLTDCFERIKSNTVANDSSPAKTNETNTQPASTPKRRSSVNNLPSSETKRITTVFICPVCTCSYKYPHTFLNHIKKQHRLSHNAIPDGCIGQQCPYCPVISFNNNHNKHVRQNHPEKYEERVENTNTLKTGNAKCTIKSKETNAENNKTSLSPNSASVNKLKHVQIGDDNIDKRNDGRDEEHAARTSRSADMNNENQIDKTTNVNDINTRIANNTLPNDNLHDNCETSRQNKTQESGTREKSIAERCIESNTINKDTMSATNDTRNEQCLSTKETNNLVGIDSSSSSNNSNSDSVKSLASNNKPSKVSYVAENRKQKVNERSEENKCSGEQFIAFGNNVAVEKSNQITCSAVNKEIETATKSDGDVSHDIDSKKGKRRTITLSADKKESLMQNKPNEEARKEQDQTSHHTEIKKRKTRTITLFSNKSDALVQNKTNEDARTVQENHELNKEVGVLLKNKDNANTDRNVDEAHGKRQTTVEKHIETADSSNANQIITTNESAGSNDSSCTTKSKDQVVRKLFSDVNGPVQNTESGGSCNSGKKTEQIRNELLTEPEDRDSLSKAMNKSNDYKNNSTSQECQGDVTTNSDDESIKPCRNAAKKRKERLSKLFGDDLETASSSTSDKINEKDPVHNDKDARHNQSNIQEDAITTSDDETIKSSKHAVKKRQERLSKLFGDDMETSTSGTINENDEIGSEKVVVDNIPNVHEDAPETGDNETITLSKHAVEKRKERLSKLFGDDMETTMSSKINEKDEIENEKDVMHNSSNIHEDSPETGDDETIKLSKHAVEKRKTRLSKLFGDDMEMPALGGINEKDKNGSEKDVSSNIHEHVPDTGDDETIKLSKHAAKKRKERLSKLFGDDDETSLLEKGSENQARNEQIEEETGHKSDQNYKATVKEKNNVNALHNAETITHDSDQVEIDMIDNLLNELDVPPTVTQQNSECTEKEHHVNVEDSSEVRVDNSLQVNKDQKESGLENVQITNVTSITNKIHIFVCQDCNYGTDIYDNTIRHCQNHYNRIEDQVTYCNTCQINYDQECFEKHQAYHDDYLQNMKIKFSYRWLFTNWQSVFENNAISLNDAEEMQVTSIYKTFCVKMTVKQDGPWQSAVYVCAKCNTCVPPLNIQEHVNEGCAFTRHPCSLCDRAFLTQELKNHHEIYHMGEDNLFKTIVLNDKDDDNFNATLLLAKEKSNEKEEIVDIFKCLCGLCFNTMKRLKLHFVDCDSEINDGEQCPYCSGVQSFLSTELEEHVSLHESLFKYKFRVNQIAFQQESDNDDSIQDTSYDTENITEMTNNEESNIKNESLTQDTYEENNIGFEDDSGKEKDIRESKVETAMAMETSDSSAENEGGISSIDEDLQIKRDMLKDESLTQNSIENNSQEMPNDNEKEELTQSINEEVSELSINREGTHIMDAAESESITEDAYKENRLGIEHGTGNEEVARDSKVDSVDTATETSDTSAENEGQINSIDEDLQVKREMLKDESLTQNSIENNSQEIPDTEDKEEPKQTNGDVSEHVINREATQIMDATESENPVNIEVSQLIEGEEESERPMNEENLQDMNDIVPEHPITEANLQENEVEEPENQTSLELSKESEPEQPIIIECSQETEASASPELTRVEEPEIANMETDQDMNVSESDPPATESLQELNEPSEEIMDVDKIVDFITIDDSDDEVEFVAEEQSSIRRLILL